MGKLQPGHIVEALLWLGLAAFLYAYSFEFDREIEIYKYGASAWPRAILLLIVVAAIGQLAYFWKRGDSGADSKIGSLMQERPAAAEFSTPGWYARTAFLLALPFVYINVPQWIASAWSFDKPGLHTVKLIAAALILIAFVLVSARNHLGGMLASPILFAALIQDYGFYALAPLFIFAVMFLMGERRYGRMIAISLSIYALLLVMFVSLLYVGLPIGNISPFYEFGAELVNLLQ